MKDLEKVQKTLSDVFDYLNKNGNNEVGKRLLTEVGDAHRIVENLVITDVVVPKGTLCQHDRKVTNRVCDDCGSVITYVPDEHLASRLKKAITVTHCCTPKGTVKTIDFERTIDLLDAEIDSLKDAYHQETIADRKTQYSSMILESLHAKKKLKQ